jgi:hypothetical protein
MKVSSNSGEKTRIHNQIWQVNGKSMASQEKNQVHNQIRQVNSKSMKVSDNSEEKSGCMIKLGKSIVSQWKLAATQGK